MADTTLNVRVVNNGGGGGGTQPTTPPNPPTPGGFDMPSNDKMIEDIRREMQQRGVVMVPGSQSMAQIIQQYGANLRQQQEKSIRTDYVNLRQSNIQERDDLLKQIEEKKRNYIQNYLGKNPDNPSDVDYYYHTDHWSRRREEIREINANYEKRTEELNASEEDDVAKADERLVKAIEELTKYFEREVESGGGAESGGNSYIGQLRAQQRALILERDSAETKEEAQDASKRLANVNNQLREAMGGGPQARPMYDSMLQGWNGMTTMLDGVDNVDPSSVIMGGAGAIAGFGRMGLKSAMRFLGIAGLIAGGVKSVWKGISGAAGRLEGGRATLAGMLDDDPERLGEQEINQVNQQGYKSKYSGQWNFGVHTAVYDPSDFGLSTEQFADKAIEVIRARGMRDNWREQVYLSMSNERAWGMNSGAILQGMKYDRYQNDRQYGTNKYLVDLVTKLGNMEVDGIRIKNDGQNDFTRVQEVFDIQQQIMSGYMSRTDKPNYYSANQWVEAFSAMRGITQDSRIGSDIESFQEMIRNPMNDRMRALLYDVVQDVVPTYNGQSTAGRTDLIDQALHDPELEGKIMLAAVQRVKSMFGGPNTQMGYWAFKQLLPNITPDRMISEVNELDEEKIQKLLKGEYWDNSASALAIDKQMYMNVDRAKGFTTSFTASIEGIKNDIHQIWDKLCN